MELQNGNAGAPKEGRNENVSVKFTQSKKDGLKIEAAKLGISLSDLCEGRVSNFEAVRQEGLKAKEEAAAWKMKASKLESELANSANNTSRLQKEAEEYKRQLALLSNDSMSNVRRGKEIEELKKQLEALKSLGEIFGDKHLLWLFSQVKKGETKTVNCPYGGSLTIQFNEPKDLLKAMIYSIRIKE